MALQGINHLLLASTPLYGGNGGVITLNAANESLAVIGCVRWVNRASPKTISSAGGAILWSAANGMVFATATSTLRLGLMDPDPATGLEDGTFDVYKEFVQGTDAMPNNVLGYTPMTVGSKTLADGDLVAIVAKMPVRAGSDSIVINSVNTMNQLPTLNVGFPYGTSNTAGTLARHQSLMLFALLVADDGTVGWIEGLPLPLGLISMVNLSLNLNSTPDEYIGTFAAPARFLINSIGLALNNIVVGENFEVLLYQNPYGSPIVLATVAADPDLCAQTNVQAGLHLYPIPPTILVAGTTYGIAVRPTTTGSINLSYVNLAAAGLAATTQMANVIKAACFLPQLKLASRTNQTGAFVEVATTAFPVFVIDVCGLDDGLPPPAAAYAYA